MFLSATVFGRTVDYIRSLIEGVARRRKDLVLTSVVLVLSAAWGCGGKPFNVRRRPERPPADYRVQGQIDGLMVYAIAMTNEDDLLETFDANLILAGVLPVDLMMTNSGVEARPLRSTKFSIKSGDGRSFEATDARQAYKRLVSYYSIGTYSKEGYKRSLSDFSSHALDTSSPLEAGESRQGVVFFEMPMEVAREGDLILVAARLNKSRTKTDSDSILELKLK